MLETRSTNPHDPAPGATNSARAKGVRGFLYSILEAFHPDKPKDAIYTDFRTQLADHTQRASFMEEIIKYWFDNMYRLDTAHLDRLRQAPPSPDAIAILKKRAQEEEKRRLQIEELRAKLVKIKLLDMILPNGKRIRDCTGLELREMAPRVGLWLFRLAERVPLYGTANDFIDATSALTDWVKE